MTCSLPTSAAIHSPRSPEPPRPRGLNAYTLSYEHVEHVVTLTYNRPEQHNAVNRTMNVELHYAWQRFRDDDDAFVLVGSFRG